MIIDKSTLYSLEDIINNVPLPVVVRKPNWTNNFTFRVEKVQNGIAYGTSFKNGKEYHRFWGDYNYRLFEQFYYVETGHVYSVEELLQTKEEELYNEVFLKGLYDIECSNSDDGTYERYENYLRNFLGKYGVSLEKEDKTLVKESFLKSASCKRYGELLEENLKYYTLERSYIPWDKKETSVSQILDSIIEASIQGNRPLTKQYARILASRYFVSDCADSNFSKDRQYRNLLVFVSDKEFNTWVVNDAGCFERIVRKAANRLKKSLVNEIDEQTLVVQIIQAKKFKDVVSSNPFVLENAKSGKYRSLIDLYFRPDQEPKHTESKDNVSEPSLEQFLSLIKKKPAGEANNAVIFLNSIGPEMELREVASKNTQTNNINLQWRTDDEIELLQY